MIGSSTCPKFRSKWISKARYKKLVRDKKIDQTTLDDALTLFGALDPPGVGARDLQECLLLQIESERGAR